MFGENSASARGTEKHDQVPIAAKSRKVKFLFLTRALHADIAENPGVTLNPWKPVETRKRERTHIAQTESLSRTHSVKYKYVICMRVCLGGSYRH